MKELSRELSHEIVEACGGEACVELIQREPHALRVLLLVALLPGLGLKMIRDAYPDTAMAQKRLRPVLDEMQARGLAFQNELTYLLYHMPTSQQMQKWLQSAAFARLREQARKTACSFFKAIEESPIPFEMLLSRYGGTQALTNCYRECVSYNEGPDFLTPFMLARLLRLCGEHAMAYDLLQIFAPVPHLMDHRSTLSLYSYGRLELRVIFYRLLGNKAENASSLPRDMQMGAACDNIILKSLARRVEDDIMRDRQSVLDFCQQSDDEAELGSIIFHGLQAGQWDAITSLAARKDAPENIRMIAAKFCKWQKEGNWSALKGILKRLPEEARPMMAPIVAIANRVNRLGMPVVIEALKYERSSVFGKSRSLLSANFVNLLMPEEEHAECGWHTERPLALLPLLLSSMRSGLVNSHADLLRASIDACYTLHERGLTLYSWYMACILCSMQQVRAEERARLLDIINSRQDLPKLPGVSVFSNAEDLLVEKFLKLAQELSSPEGSKETDDGRLEWRVEADAQGIVSAISPLLRKRTAKGGLSKGRQIGLFSLLQGNYEEWVTPEDKRLLSRVEHKLSYYEDYYYLPMQAAEELCRHPYVRVLMAGEETQQAVLTATTPKLVIRKTGQKMEVALPEEAHQVHLVRTGENTFDLCIPSSGVIKLRELITHIGGKNKLQFPLSAKDKITQALRALDSHFTLSGDLQFTHEHLPELVSASRLVINLKGEHGNLSGNIRIEPYEGAPLLHPGKGDSQQVITRGTEQMLLKRRLTHEKSQVAKLMQQCPTLHEHISADLNLQTQDLESALEVLHELQELEAGEAEVRWPVGCALSLSTLSSMKAFQISCSEGVDYWLEISGKVQVDEQKVLGFTELLQLYRNRRGSYLQLDEGHYLKLTSHICRQLETLSALQPAPDKNGKIRKKLALTPAAIALLARNSPAGQLPDALEKHVAEFREKAEQCSAPSLPRALQADLRDYQLHGFRWLMQQTGCGLGACLADDMGLGKTLQVLAVLLARAQEGPSLVLAPASVCGNWVREAARFTPTLRLWGLNTPQREATLRNLGPRDVLVCSYGLLVSEAELLSSMQWNVVVLDEAQAIKNSQSQRAESTRRLQARYRIAATGTPLENNLMELWSLMEFLNPDYLGAHGSFMARFKNAPGQLRKLVAPFILRRLKNDVLDELPEKTEQTIHVDLSPDERALYESVRREALEQVNQDSARFQVLALLTRLRRLCCHPRLIAPECGIEHPAKLEALRELASELKASGHRALIFSQFTDVLAHVQQLCKEEQHSFLYLDGSTPAARRTQLVDTFQQGETDFFLISLKAGGVGLNLTAADYVILLDPWWNPAVEDQAADRTHRIGQQKAVTICRLVCADTIEEKVLALHARKREMFDSIINEQDTDTTTFSVQELMELLN